MAAAALVVAIVALAAACGSLFYTRAQAHAARDAVHDARRQDAERKRDRAGRLRFELVAGPMFAYGEGVMMAGDPLLSLTNDSDVTFTAIDVAIEAFDPDAPPAHIEHIAFLAAAGQRHAVTLPKEHGRLMVTWWDPDGTLWRCRHAGVDYNLERLN